MATQRISANMPIEGNLTGQIDQLHASLRDMHDNLDPLVEREESPLKAAESVSLREMMNDLQEMAMHLNRRIVNLASSLGTTYRV